MVLITHFLVVYVMSLVRGVYPQAQPCLVCGDAVLRMWSLMSRQGDHFLRITDQKSDTDDDDDNNDHLRVDFGGSLQSNNLTSILKIREKPTIDETRVQFIIRTNNMEYDLYAPSTTSELLAMPSSEGVRQTDHRNTFAPERLLYEHRLFTVFQSVKFRGYYLSCDGSGKTSLTQVINKAYRDPSQLFLVIDPGNAIRGAAFGAGVSIGRKKRDIWQEKYAKPRPKTSHVPARITESKILRMSQKRRCIKPLTTPKPTAVTTSSPRPPTPTESVKQSSVVVKVDLPDEITFVVCFWIRTTASTGQLISLVEHVPRKKMEPVWRWKRHVQKKSKNGKESKVEDKNIFDITIYKGFLRLEIGYQRIVRTYRYCKFNDGKFHHVCVSLNDQYILAVYRDSRLISQERLADVSCDFVEKKTDKRRGTLTLGAPKDSGGQPFDGRLYQVNLWDMYPAFRIQRIATNCACGGGNLVKWEDILSKASMSGVEVFDDFECPKLEGYNYDEQQQSRLI